jgi:hypothetical protein
MSNEAALKELRKLFLPLKKHTDEWCKSFETMTAWVRGMEQLYARLPLIIQPKFLGVLANFHQLDNRLYLKHVQQIEALQRALQIEL